MKIRISATVPAVGNFSRQSAHCHLRRGFLDRPLSFAPGAARLAVSIGTLPMSALATREAL